ncbi:hypothetical protein DM860_004911 [Cuscuta australis]|uniref:Uncharacterized protein n=1 Tax=Cuscuta australis TaxID=267555 RepID=A0A328DLT5_9ASTE|nr:hypothetical protein DM860_004911 [Cuscuta australis]
MDKGPDPTRRRQPHGFYGGCVSPSFAVPAHEVYSRINGGGCRKQSPSSWRRIIRKLVNDGKGLCRSKPASSSFHYDAASYSKNFDDGRRSDDEFPRRHQFCRRDVRIISE